MFWHGSAHSVLLSAAKGQWSSAALPMQIAGCSLLCASFASDDVPFGLILIWSLKDIFVVLGEVLVRFHFGAGVKIQHWMWQTRYFWWLFFFFFILWQSKSAKQNRVIARERKKISFGQTPSGVALVLCPTCFFVCFIFILEPFWTFYIFYR